MTKEKYSTLSLYKKYKLALTNLHSFDMKLTFVALILLILKECEAHQRGFLLPVCRL